MKKLLLLLSLIFISLNANAGAIADTFSIIIFGINFLIFILAVAAGIGGDVRLAWFLAAVGLVMFVIVSQFY